MSAGHALSANARIWRFPAVAKVTHSAACRGYSRLLRSDIRAGKRASALWRGRWWLRSGGLLCAAGQLDGRQPCELLKCHVHRCSTLRMARGAYRCSTERSFILFGGGDHAGRRTMPSRRGYFDQPVSGWKPAAASSGHQPATGVGCGRDAGLCRLGPGQRSPDLHDPHRRLSSSSAARPAVGSGPCGPRMDLASRFGGRTESAS